MLYHSSENLYSYIVPLHAVCERCWGWPVMCVGKWLQWLIKMCDNRDTQESL